MFKDDTATFHIYRGVSGIPIGLNSTIAAQDMDWPAKNLISPTQPIGPRKIV
jgi:hypothetical protein